jgi:formylmethanofuran dehydrogenase subunit D
MDMIINTVRKIEHDQAKEHAFEDDKSLKENVAIAVINPENLKNLNLQSNSNLKITSQFGNVILRVQEDKDIPKGMIYIPVSIWANQLTGIINDQLIYKNLKASVEPSSEPVLDFKELLLKIKPN